MKILYPDITIWKAKSLARNVYNCVICIQYASSQIPVLYPTAPPLSGSPQEWGHRAHTPYHLYVPPAHSSLRAGRPDIRTPSFE